MNVLSPSASAFALANASSPRGGEAVEGGGNTHGKPLYRDSLSPALFCRHGAAQAVQLGASLLRNKRLHPLTRPLRSDPRELGRLSVVLPQADYSVKILVEIADVQAIADEWLDDYTYTANGYTTSRQPMGCAANCRRLTRSEAPQTPKPVIIMSSVPGSGTAEIFSTVAVK